MNTVQYSRTKEGANKRRSRFKHHVLNSEYWRFILLVMPGELKTLHSPVIVLFALEFRFLTRRVTNTRPTDTRLCVNHRRPLQACRRGYSNRSRRRAILQPILKIGSSMFSSTSFLWLDFTTLLSCSCQRKLVEENTLFSSRFTR